MNLRNVIGLVIAYASVVILFESLLGYYQPQSDGTLTITTTNSAAGCTIGCCPESSPTSSRHCGQSLAPCVVSPTLANPRSCTLDGETKAYTAVAVAGNEHDQVDQAFLALGFSRSDWVPTTLLCSSGSTPTQIGIIARLVFIVYCKSDLASFWPKG